MRMNGTRWTLLGLIAIAGTAMWQASYLDLWSFSGPGPGLFPQVTAAATATLAAICVLFPERKSALSEDDGVTDFFGAEREERRTFWLYSLSLVLLIPGVIWAGFWVTAACIITFLMRFAERRPWPQSILFAVVVATLGLFGFGWLLQVSLPSSTVDRFLLSLVH